MNEQAPKMMKNMMPMFDIFFETFKRGRIVCYTALSPQVAKKPRGVYRKHLLFSLYALVTAMYRYALPFVLKYVVAVK